VLWGAWLALLAIVWLCYLLSPITPRSSSPDGVDSDFLSVSYPFCGSFFFPCGFFGWLLWEVTLPALGSRWFIQRLILYLWKLVWGLLPTRADLLERSKHESLLYALCELWVEFIKHLFLSAPVLSYDLRHYRQPNSPRIWLARLVTCMFAICWYGQ
jgi:hypothetical protein